MRKRGFCIGKKGEEIFVDTFEMAIDKLKSMKMPYWRRPNAAGNWGIVAGITWNKVKIDDY